MKIEEFLRFIRFVISLWFVFRMSYGIKCAWCGSNKNLVQHHISYKPEIIITLCKQCHASRHVQYGRCVLCERKGFHRRYFACVDPKTGLSFWDKIIHPVTGNLNSPWSRKGKWILVCNCCRERAIGLTIALPGGNRQYISEDVARHVQSRWNVDLEKAKEQWLERKRSKEVCTPFRMGTSHR